MKQCCANCKWLKKSHWEYRCTFLDEPARKPHWWRTVLDRPLYFVTWPSRAGKTCKCWQENR